MHLWVSIVSCPHSAILCLLNQKPYAKSISIRFFNSKQHLSFVVRLSTLGLKSALFQEADRDHFFGRFPTNGFPAGRAIALATVVVLLRGHQGASQAFVAKYVACESLSVLQHRNRTPFHIVPTADGCCGVGVALEANDTVPLSDLDRGILLVCSLHFERIRLLGLE